MQYFVKTNKFQFECFSKKLANADRILTLIDSDSNDTIGLVDAKKFDLYKSNLSLDNLMKLKILKIIDEVKDDYIFLETHGKIAWFYDGKNRYSSILSYNELNEKLKHINISGWLVPEPKALSDFYKLCACNNYLGNLKRQSTLWEEIISDTELNFHDKFFSRPDSPRYFMTQKGWISFINKVDKDSDSYDVVNEIPKLKMYDLGYCQTPKGYIIACNKFWTNDSNSKIISNLIDLGWYVETPCGEKLFLPETKKNWGITSEEQLFNYLKEGSYQLICSKTGNLIDDSKAKLDNLASIDYTPCRLPKIEPNQLYDINKGLWELWDNTDEELNQQGIVARNPLEDVRCRDAIAIDFGTSSTVVAMTTKNDTKQLLRIGVRDFYQAPKARDYENPTVLEILDFNSTQNEWNQITYRPPLDWNWLHASHEAQASYRDNMGDTAILASILPKLKQWATRSDKQTIRLTDRKNIEVVIPPLLERNPIQGEMMSVSKDDPFDPIELYAWFLGMAINWRGRGIYLKYYMSFPVKYEKATKDKVLASFRRGLQRSLPKTLVEQLEPLKDFEVSEIASEPTAYAAAALNQLGLLDNAESISYAVFDFGGGTSDFDFGLWRWANDEEESQGYEQIFESIRSSGDNFLGGENLLENLVYNCFQQNLEACRQSKIHFTRPLDANPFAGDEIYIQQTQAAQTNTVLLASQLRDFMESPAGDLPPQLKIDLLDFEGKKQTCEFSLDKCALEQWLFDRIKRGVEAFLIELAQASDELPKDQAIHILLAGNGCRSRHIKTIFDEKGPHWQNMVQQAFGQSVPKLIIHMPFERNEAAQHAPTAKTGVALGLLSLCPGEGFKLIDNVRTQYDDEAPFRFFVGNMRRGTFDAKLTPNSAYQKWQPVGMLPEGVFKLCFSQSPRTLSGLKAGDPELTTCRLHFSAAQANDLLFVKAISPTCIELATAQDQASIESNNHSRTQIVDLETEVAG